MAVNAALEAHRELAVVAGVKQLVHFLHPCEACVAPILLLRHVLNALVNAVAPCELRGERADAGRLGQHEHRLHVREPFLQEYEVLMHVQC